METTRKIVVGVDGTDTGACALSRALEMAAIGVPTEVHAIRVLDAVSDPLLGSLVLSSAEGLKELTETLQTAVQALIAANGELRVAAVVAHAAVGSPARSIVALAAQLDADLIVVGTHGRRGLRRAILGSVAEEVVRTAGCAVFAVRPKGHPLEARVPVVEPLCEQCAETRFESKNEQLWCARHSIHHPRAHVYHYDSRSTDAARPWGFDA